MLTIPVFDTLDEDVAYYGWTDNVSFLKSTLLGTKAVSTATPATRIQRKKSALKKPLSAQDRATFLSNKNTFFEEYETPITYELRFNSLRSGRFGSTDPFISKLFSFYKSEEQYIGTENDFDPDLDDSMMSATRNSGDSVHNKDLVDYLEDLFKLECEQSEVDERLQIPGELSEAFRSMSTTVVAKENNAENYWQQQYGQTDKAIASFVRRPSANAFYAMAIKQPFHIHTDIDTEDQHNPTYDFPSKSRSSKKRPNKRDTTILPPGYLMSNMDRLHV